MPRSMLRTPLPRVLTLAVLGLFVASLVSAPAQAKKSKKDEAPPAGAEKKDEDSPYKDWDKTLKDTETQKGLFIVHRKHDSTWFEIAPDQLDKPYLMVSSLSTGLGKGWLLGGMPLDTDLWYFRKAGNKIQITVKNTRFRASDGSPMSHAVKLSYSDSVLTTAKIVSINKDTKNYLLEMNDVLVSDLPGIGIALKQFLGGPASFDKDRSSITHLKTFPKNVEIEVGAMYVAPEARPLETVSDPRYLPLGIHYSLSELPDNNYHARAADDRVGYFLTALKDFSRDSADSFFVRYINRWKLEKQDPGAPLSPPKEPIVFYIDRTIPEEYRGYVRGGLLMWNKAFEKAGFKDAIVAKDAPDDPDFDPEDVRYNTIRWITSTEPSFGAIGPSRVDPRNGHILDADILIEASMVQNVRRGYRNYVNTLSSTTAMGSALPGASPFSWTAGAAGPSSPPPAGSDRPDSRMGPDPMALCSFADGAELGAAVDAALFQATGEMEPGGVVPEEYIGQFLHWVVAHEVGHTLGLRHNFRASAATPYERLNDVSWTRENGLYNSVMEYPSPNISVDRRIQGDYYTNVVGTYDIWAIKYGYTQLDAKTPDDETQALRLIAEQSTKPGHEYGSDDDAFAGPVPIGVDPDVNQFDLGGDPLAYGRDRLTLIRTVRAKIHKNVIAPGESYDRLRNTFESLTAAQGQVLQIVSKQLGGLRTSRSHRGDPGERPAFVAVPAARQREAMTILLDSGFSDAAWAVEPELLNALQPSHWWHWGSNAARAIPLDYPYSDRILDIQSELLERLFHPILLARILETESRTRKAEAYTLAEHMRQMTDAVFSELSPRSGSVGGLTISAMRRNLGRAGLDRLIMVMNYPSFGTPEDARSLARANLVNLEKRMTTALTTRAAGMEETTKAYLEDSRARIRRALDAQAIVLG